MRKTSPDIPSVSTAKMAGFLPNLDAKKLTALYAITAVYGWGQEWSERRLILLTSYSAGNAHDRKRSRVRLVDPRNRTERVRHPAVWRNLAWVTGGIPQSTNELAHDIESGRGRK